MYCVSALAKVQQWHKATPLQMLPTSANAPHLCKCSIPLWVPVDLHGVLSLQIFDQYLNFLSLEDDLFVTRHQNTHELSYCGKKALLPLLPPLPSLPSPPPSPLLPPLPSLPSPLPPPLPSLPSPPPLPSLPFPPPSPPLPPPPPSTLPPSPLLIC